MVASCVQCCIIHNIYIMAAHGNERIYDTEANQKPCRTCTDFKSWAKQQKTAFSKEHSSERDDSTTARRIDCPLDKNELGNKTWGFLHTMAAKYPEKPTPQERADMSNFFTLFSKFYPCHICAEDFREELKVTPPVTESQSTLSQWLCRMHNNVNRKIGKPEFDCSRVNERWRDGWLDGSCD